ncbi:MAG: phosphonate ABC transporter, permease protein PhnE [Rhodospirillaceae bacterium]|jgi:phosphonate transport system permease protein|nr:phosphonate ABC transporter, permease protein PhnE [Rhodospirillaceae bacterium]|tara:strand:+ start:2956 stop:3768 length:813 start_codon:yes stop_codon:yes gene_type:complete
MSPAEHALKHPEIWRRFSPRQTLIRYVWYVGVVFVAVWSVRSLNLPWEYFEDAMEQAMDLFTRMVPPDWKVFSEVVDALVETIHIATLGTIVTVFISFPIAFLAARNTTVNRTTWVIGRFILVASRSINTVVWALLFVAIFGPGPVAGIWAIAFRSIGFMGKLVAEAIEEIDEGAVEAIEATGASRLQVLWVGILPQVLPVIYGTTIYRWDINIRESTVLGFVGAGGIGILLYSTMNLFRWEQVSVLLIAIFCVVVISEFISAAARSRIT